MHQAKHSEGWRKSRLSRQVRPCSRFFPRLHIEISGTQSMSLWLNTEEKEISLLTTQTPSILGFFPLSIFLRHPWNISQLNKGSLGDQIRCRQRHQVGTESVAQTEQTPPHKGVGAHGILRFPLPPSSFDQETALGKTDPAIICLTTHSPCFLSKGCPFPMQWRMLLGSTKVPLTISKERKKTSSTRDESDSHFGYQLHEIKFENLLCLYHNSQKTPVEHRHARPGQDGEFIRILMRHHISR